MGQVLGWVLENTLVFSPRGLASTHDASGAVLGTEVQPKPTGALLSNDPVTTSSVQGLFYSCFKAKFLVLITIIS